MSNTDYLSEPSEDTDIIEQEDDLLFSLEVGPRIFLLNNTSETSLLGVLTEETEDSFLVSLPARLVRTDSDVEIVPYGNSEYFRLMKTGVTLLMFLCEPYTKHYLEYIKNYDGLYDDNSDPDSEADTTLEDKLLKAAEKGGLIVNNTKTKH